MFSMWGWGPDVTERIQSGLAARVTPEQAAEAKAKKEAEKKVEDEGCGTCNYCKEEIVKNERGLWESDFLLEYCTDARDHKHKPLIQWRVDG